MSPLAELLRDPPASWGVAYVLRGSRLGGSVIAPLLTDTLELPDGRGASFLASAGAEPGRDWVMFRRRLDAATLSASDLERAVDAARWTFGWVGDCTIGRRFASAVGTA